MTYRLGFCDRCEDLVERPHACPWVAMARFEIRRGDPRLPQILSPGFPLARLKPSGLTITERGVGGRVKEEKPPQ